MPGRRSIPETTLTALFRSQVCGAGIKELRDRIVSVKNTKKITDAMKLVAAAKVRRAQDAVVNGRPFAENLVKVGKPTSRLPNVVSFYLCLCDGLLAGVCGRKSSARLRRKVSHGRILSASGDLAHFLTALPRSVCAM